MRKLWLIFSQTATIAVALLFVIATLRPEWLPGGAGGMALNPEARVISLRDASPALLSSAKANSYSEAVRKAVPAVVNIYTSKEVKAQRNPFFNDPVFRQFFGDRFDDQPQRAQGLGSGVIVSDKGYILTNQHVIEAADEIEVALSDGRKLRATSVGSDPETDLAVLQVSAASLPAITFGDDVNLKLGDVVLAIGNPFGVGQTVTMGIVSGLGRTPGINTFENFIQTDAAINPGNSGGALVDAAGSLIGINTAIYSQSGGSLGIGFSIPASTAKRVLESIVQNGTVKRGWIGVEAQEITAELADSFKLSSTSGALIAGVLRGGPAEKAGIKPGDILTSISGKQVKNPTAMLDLVAALEPGKPATIKVQRNRKDIDVQVEVGVRPNVQRRRR
jgi:Do/DeqQ family serine protease